MLNAPDTVNTDLLKVLASYEELSKKLIQCIPAHTTLPQTHTCVSSLDKTHTAWILFPFSHIFFLPRVNCISGPLLLTHTQWHTYKQRPIFHVSFCDNTHTRIRIHTQAQGWLSHPIMIHFVLVTLHNRLVMTFQSFGITDCVWIQWPIQRSEP